jgi:hypothetical protein
MQEKENNTTFTEAVAIFHDAQSLHATVDELLTSGFDHAELSVLACEQTIREKLGHNYKSTADFDDDPDAPRVGYVPDESIGSAQGGIIAAAGYFPAVIGLLAVVASGGTLLGQIAVVAIAGGAGAALGATRAILVRNVHAKHLEQHLRHGGLLLWVRTHDAAHEKKALEILSRHSGEDVHMHTMKQPTNRLQSPPVRRPLVSFGPPA